MKSQLRIHPIPKGNIIIDNRHVYSDIQLEFQTLIDKQIQKQIQLVTDMSSQIDSKVEKLSKKIDKVSNKEKEVSNKTLMGEEHHYYSSELEEVLSAYNVSSLHHFLVFNKPENFFTPQTVPKQSILLSLIQQITVFLANCQTEDNYSLEYDWLEAAFLELDANDPLTQFFLKDIIKPLKPIIEKNIHTDAQARTIYHFVRYFE